MKAKRRMRMGVRSAIATRSGSELVFFPERIKKGSNIKMDARIPAMDVLKMEETAKVMRERMSMGSVHPAAPSEKRSASSNVLSRYRRRIPRITRIPQPATDKNKSAATAF